MLSQARYRASQCARCSRKDGTFRCPLLHAHTAFCARGAFQKGRLLALFAKLQLEVSPSVIAALPDNALAIEPNDEGSTKEPKLGGQKEKAQQDSKKLSDLLGAVSGNEGLASLSPRWIST